MINTGLMSQTSTNNWKIGVIWYSYLKKILDLSLKLSLLILEVAKMSRNRVVRILGWKRGLIGGITNRIVLIVVEGNGIKSTIIIRIGIIPSGLHSIHLHQFLKTIPYCLPMNKMPTTMKVVWLKTTQEEFTQWQKPKNI